MAPNHQFDLLTGSYLFRDLAPSLVRRISALALVRRLRANQVLFLKNDRGDALYGVLKGRIRISATSPGGQEIILDIMGPGEIFGEIALLDGMPRTADAVAMTATELMMIRRHEFLALLEREPSLAIHLLKLICKRLRALNEQIEDSAFLGVPARLAKRLLIMAQQGEQVNDGIRVRLQPSQSQLGQMLGASRVSINKHLQRWKKNDWISLSRGCIVIRNRAALQMIIDEGLQR